MECEMKLSDLRQQVETLQLLVRQSMGLILLLIKLKVYARRNREDEAVMVQCMRCELTVSPALPSVYTIPSCRGKEE